MSPILQMRKLRQENFSYLPKFTQLKKRRISAGVLRFTARLSDCNTGSCLLAITGEEGEESVAETPLPPLSVRHWDLIGYTCYPIAVSTTALAE